MSDFELVGAMGAPSAESVRELEREVAKLPQVNLQTQMLLHGSMCARTIFIPAGTVLTGCQTNLDNVCVVYGDITVTTESGPKRLTGFNVIPANKGAKRAGIAHSDTWWTTIHHTELSDMKEIEEEMTNEPDNLQTRRVIAINQQEQILTLGD